MKKALLLTALIFCSISGYSQKEVELNKQAIELAKKGKLDEAIDVLNKSIEANPNTYSSYANRGNIFKMQKKYDLAISDYSKSLSLSSDPQILHMRAKTYMEMNEFINAVVDYSAIIEEDDRYPDIYFDRAFAFIRLENYKYAKADFESQLKITPKDFKSIANLAAVKRELKLYDEALADYNKILSDYPNQGNMHILYNNRAGIYFDLEQYQKALEDADKAINLNKDYAIGYLTRGEINLKLGKNKEACADYNKAIELGVLSNRNFKADKNFEELKKACEL